MVNLATPYIWYQSPTALYGTAGAGGGFSAEATAFFARLPNDPGTTQKNLYAAVIDGLKGGSTDLWTGMKGFWFLAEAGSGFSSAQAQANANIDATANGFNLTNHSCTYTQHQGYVGVDTNTTPPWIDTGITPSTSLHLNSGAIGAWVNNNVQSSASGGIIMGATTGAAKFRIVPRYSTFGFFINWCDSSAASQANSDSRGLCVSVRTDSTHSQGYLGSGSTPFYSPNAGSNSLPTSTIALCADNAGASQQFGSPHELSIAFVYDSASGGITGANVATIAGLLATYRTGVGVV